MTGAREVPLLLVTAALLGGVASSGCASSSPRGRSIADPLDGPDAIVAIGRSGDIVYAVTRSRQLRAWDLRTRALRTLRRAGVIGIARDGAVALSVSDTTVAAWEPASGRLIATHRFEYGMRRRARYRRRPRTSSPNDNRCIGRQTRRRRHRPTGSSRPGISRRGRSSLGTCGSATISGCLPTAPGRCAI